MTDGNYTCGELGATHRVVDSLCWTSETNITWCTDYTAVRKKHDFIC